jgi:hypothetical protein
MNARPEGKTKILFLILVPARSLTFARGISPESGQGLHRNGSETTSSGIGSGESNESAFSFAPGLLKPRFT